MAWYKNFDASNKAAVSTCYTIPPSGCRSSILVTIGLKTSGQVYDAVTVSCAPEKKKKKKKRFTKYFLLRNSKE